MSEPDRKQPAPKDVAPPQPPPDPLVISAIHFREPVPIGGHGCEEWTMQGIAQNQYHGRSRVQEQPYGILVVYKAGEHYEEIKVPWGNLRSFTSIPLSRLSEKQRDLYERLQQEIKR